MNLRKGFTLIELLVVVAILFVLFVLAVSVVSKPGRLIGGINSSYSTGSRIGKIIKFGEKTNFYGGYKSWEGAMQMSDFGLQSQNQPFSTVNGNVWEFSIDSTATPALTDKILQAMKEQRSITLTYHQYWSRPATICTEYVITGAEFPEDVRKPEK